MCNTKNSFSKTNSTDMPSLHISVSINVGTWKYYIIWIVLGITVKCINLIF